MTFEDIEVWGLGILGLSRLEFMYCTFDEFSSRIKGFMIRTHEHEQIGARRILTQILNGFGSFSKSFTPKNERNVWPMSIDKLGRDPELSSELVRKNANMIKNIWPDVNIDG